MRVAGFAFRRRTEHGGHVVVAFHVRLVCEIEVTAVGLRFAREGGLQVLFSLAAFKFHSDSCVLRPILGWDADDKPPLRRASTEKRTLHRF